MSYSWNNVARLPVPDPLPNDAKLKYTGIYLADKGPVAQLEIYTANNKLIEGGGLGYSLEGLKDLVKHKADFDGDDNSAKLRRREAYKSTHLEEECFFTQNISWNMICKMSHGLNKANRMPADLRVKQYKAQSSRFKGSTL